MHFDDVTLISSSPERLVRLHDRQADTRPIAGTRPRGLDARDDQRLVGELLANEKERAEHLMLVDLERNDLGRVCRFGSVQVDEFMAIEQYSHVSHIVSNVSGSLRPDATPFDLIQALFPGGTITGVPKIRCMEIIEELEPVRRGPYTGSFGYIGWNGDLDLNIVIRTLIWCGGKGYSASRCRNCRRFRPGQGIRGNAPESPGVLQRAATDITMWIYLNDRFVKEEEAVVSVFDHGFLYGDGVYETIRSYGSRIFMRDQHLARLRRSADAIGLTIPIPEHRWPRSSTKP